MISEKPKRKLTSKQRPLLSSRAAFSETASSSISSSLCSSLGLWTTRCSALLSSVRYGPLDSNHESTQLLRGTVSRFEAALLRMLTTHFPPLAACWDPTVPRVDAAADPRIRRQTHDIPGSPCKIILHMQGILPACARMLCLSDCSDKGLPAQQQLSSKLAGKGHGCRKMDNDCTLHLTPNTTDVAGPQSCEQSGPARHMFL